MIPCRYQYIQVNFFLSYLRYVKIRGVVGKGGERCSFYYKATTIFQLHQQALSSCRKDQSVLENLFHSIMIIKTVPKKRCSLLGKQWSGAKRCVIIKTIKFMVFNSFPSIMIYGLNCLSELL